MSTITEEQVVAWMYERMTSVDPRLKCHAISIHVSTKGGNTAYMHSDSLSRCESAETVSDCQRLLLQAFPTPSDLIQMRARKAAELRAEADRLEATT